MSSGELERAAETEFGELSITEASYKTILRSIGGPQVPVSEELHARLAKEAARIRDRIERRFLRELQEAGPPSGNGCSASEYLRKEKVVKGEALDEAPDALPLPEKLPAP